MKKENFSTKKRGFTLVELLIVIALISILAAVLIVVIRPQEIFKRGRDSRRIADLRNLAIALDIYISNTSQSGNTNMDNQNNSTCVDGSTSTIYISNLANITVSLPSGLGTATFTQIRGTSSQEINGNGWLPVNLSNDPLVNLTILPTDPINSTSTSFYYSYACKKDFSYEINARLEGNAEAMAKDGGDVLWLYEVGSNKKILPTSSSSDWYKDASL